MMKLKYLGAAWSRVSKMAVKASIAQGYAVTSVITNGNRNI